MRKIVSLAVGLSLGIGAALQAQVETPMPVFKSSIDLVPISAVVRDGRGRLVTTLTSADFEVFDGGERRRIVDFQLDDATPITLAVVVDVSGSMRIGRSLAQAHEMLTLLGAGLREGRDEVGVFTFDKALHEQQPFSRSAKSLDAALGSTTPFGSTSLYDAVAETARLMEARPATRRAIVVLTDGIDTSSALTPGEVSAIASAIDVPVYIVATVSPIDQEQFASRTGRASAGAAADLPELARWTGGDLLWATTPAESASTARAVLAELRHQYLIAIESSRDGAWRRLDVRTRNPRLTVRTRSGYFG